jgi:hypothetical protein
MLLRLLLLLLPFAEGLQLGSSGNIRSNCSYNAAAAAAAASVVICRGVAAWKLSQHTLSTRPALQPNLRVRHQQALRCCNGNCTHSCQLQQQHCRLHCVQQQQQQQ